MPRPATIVPWHTEEGRARLFGSRYNGGFFRLAHCFQPQLKPTYCGVASAAIVLNALRAHKGLRIDSGLKARVGGGREMPFNAYSQLTLVPTRSRQLKVRSEVEGRKGDEPGLTLDQLARKLRLQLLDVQARHANACDERFIGRFRHDLMAFLNDPDTYLVANFDGKSFGRPVGGHFSPLAAYHEESDSCLVLDVAGHKQSWYWIGLAAFCRAMHTRDGAQYRGYLLLSDTLRR